ncbi:MAG: MerR family transcriptional regulator [Lachnospiraceae bacterium]|nr:MerR family transcriptional regulator [Lachnospiraceae bacterium]
MNMNDINRLIFAKLYRKLGFSIEEIQNLFEREKRFEEIDYYDFFAGKQREIGEQIRRLERIQKQLSLYQNLFYGVLKRPASVGNTKLPELFWSFTMDQVRSMEKFPKYKPATKVVADEIFPKVRLMAVGDLSETAVEKEEYGYEWGLDFGAEDLHRFSEEQKKLLKRIPAKEYYCMFAFPGRDCILKKEMARPLYEKAGEDGVKLSGYILAELFPGGTLILYLPKN